MRAALVRARWEPSDDPPVAVRVLSALVDDVRGPVDSVAAARTVCDSEALGALYVFCSSMRKTLDRHHRARLPAHRGRSVAEQLAEVQPPLPEFHRRRQEALRLLDREFPPDN